MVRLLCACRRPRRVRVQVHLLGLRLVRGSFSVFFGFYFSDAFFEFTGVFCDRGGFGP